MVRRSLRISRSTRRKSSSSKPRRKSARLAKKSKSLRKVRRSARKARRRAAKKSKSPGKTNKGRPTRNSKKVSTSIRRSATRKTGSDEDDLAQVRDISKKFGGIMPTAQELRKSGHSGLVHRVMDLGGFLVVGKKLGLEISYKRLATAGELKYNGKYIDVNNRKHIHETLRTVANEVGHFPTRKQLQARGLYGVHKQVVKLGGCQKLAPLLQIKLTEHQARGHCRVHLVKKWTKEHGRAVVRQLAQDLGLNRMPITKEITQTHRSLADAIRERMGGIRAFADYCKLPYVVTGSWLIEDENSPGIRWTG